MGEQLAHLIYEVKPFFCAACGGYSLLTAQFGLVGRVSGLLLIVLGLVIFYWRGRHRGWIQ